MEEIGNAVYELEARQDQRVVERAVAHEAAERIEVGRAELAWSFTRDTGKRDARSLDWGGITCTPFDELRYPTRLASCSLQERLVAIDSIVALV